MADVVVAWEDRLDWGGRIAAQAGPHDRGQVVGVLEFQSMADLVHGHDEPLAPVLALPPVDRGVHVCPRRADLRFGGTQPGDLGGNQRIHGPQVARGDDKPGAGRLHKGHAGIPAEEFENLAGPLLLDLGDRVEERIALGIEADVGAEVVGDRLRLGSLIEEGVLRAVLMAVNPGMVAMAGLVSRPIRRRLQQVARRRRDDRLHVDRAGDGDPAARQSAEIFGGQEARVVGGAASVEGHAEGRLEGSVLRRTGGVPALRHDMRPGRGEPPEVEVAARMPPDERIDAVDGIDGDRGPAQGDHLVAVDRATAERDQTAIGVEQAGRVGGERDQAGRLDHGKDPAGRAADLQPEELAVGKIGGEGERRDAGGGGIGDRRRIERRSDVGARGIDFDQPVERGVRRRGLIERVIGIEVDRDRVPRLFERACAAPGDRLRHDSLHMGTQIEPEVDARRPRGAAVDRLQPGTDVDPIEAVGQRLGEPDHQLVSVRGVIDADEPDRAAERERGVVGRAKRAVGPRPHDGHVGQRAGIELNARREPERDLLRSLGDDRRPRRHAGCVERLIAARKGRHEIEGEEPAALEPLGRPGLTAAALPATGLGSAGTKHAGEQRWKTSHGDPVGGGRSQLHEFSGVHTPEKHHIRQNYPVREMRSNDRC